MPRFIVIHPPKPGGMTLEEAKQIAVATQEDPNVKGCRAFLNLSEGKAVCIWEAPEAKALVEQLPQIELPFDSIICVEVEGEGALLLQV